MTDALIASAVQARTVEDADRLEAELVKAVGGTYARNLGDLELNWSVVATAVDPRAVIFERLVNGFDAVLELEALRLDDFSCQTPSDAARKFYGVPCEGPRDLTEADRNRLAQLNLVSLHDSDDPARRPTIAVRDCGVGVTPEEMPNTILSLHRSNKLRKPYLQGVFGKGGSVACLFSRATVVVTRRHPDLLTDGTEDRIALAIIREADAPDVGLPFFRYLTRADGVPYWATAAAAPEFEPGTLVIHVGYQAEKMGQQRWDFEESIYAYAETQLFRPALPYSLLDARSDCYNRRPADRRNKPAVVMGLGQRLDQLTEKDGLLDQTRGAAMIDVIDVGKVSLR